ncbi:MAG: DUF72 domain-containing protein [Rubrobacter sp.]
MEQQRMVLEEPGEVSPPEPGLYLGTSGWSYADWEGSVYSPGLPAGARLSEYVNYGEFATVEIDSTFYGTPRRQTVGKWREIAPRGFRFTAKFPQEITHEKQLSNCKPAADAFVDTMLELGDKLGPLLVQLPPYFEAKDLSTLKAFLDELPEGLRYAVEVRHRSWTKPSVLQNLTELLVARNAALTLVDYPSMPRLEAQTADFIYIRWLGDRREFPAGHTAPKRDRSDDLTWWAGLTRRFLAEHEGREVYAFANNHYQNHSPSTVQQFLEIFRDRA